MFVSVFVSCEEGIRYMNVENDQQTDTCQQFLANEKCYVLTSNSNSFNNCLAAHERLSYSSDYPITQNWWTITNGNCSRAAELILANHDPTHVPTNVTSGSTTISLPGVTPAQVGPWRIDSVVGKNTIFTVP